MSKMSIELEKITYKCLKCGKLFTEIKELKEHEC